MMDNQVQNNPNQGAACRQKRSLIMLAICVALILIATIFGSMIQTAGWKYTTEDLRNASNTGTISLVAVDDGATEAKNYTVTGKVLSGILFRPKNAEPGSRPAVVFSHGLYNNREMQLQNAIELVRRGYVVLVIDQHNHGHNTSGTSSFFDSTHLDAAKYLYNLPEVDKARVGVSGHSMGGMSTSNVLSKDGRKAGSQKEENFKAGNNMGIVSAYLLQAANAPTSVAPNVIAVGVLKGNADEFFFNSTLKEATYVAKNRGSVTEANYANGKFYLKKGGEYVLQTADDRFRPTAQYYELTTSANTAWYLQSKQAFTFTRGFAPTAADDWATVNGGIYANGQLLAQPDGRKLVSVANKGMQLASTANSLRVVYEAKETHPMNHFSTKSAAHMIDFFYNAFGNVDGISYKAPTNQTWWIKEAFAGIGIIALFAMLLPIIDLLLQTKLFASLKGEPSEAPILLTRPRKHVSYWLGGLLTTIFGAISFHNLVAEGNWYSKLGLNKLLDNAAEGFIYVNVGKMAAWGMMCAVFAIVVTGLIWLVNHIINVIKYGDDFAAHDERPFEGFKIRSWGNILKTIGLAAILVAIFYGTVTLIWNTTRVQMQVWVFGPRVFNFERIASMVKYIPFFAIYYVVMAALAQGYRVKDLPEWATIAINVVFNVAGFMIIVWYANSYFINNGAMIHTSNNMHYIHAFPMIPSIAIATVMARRIYVRTGNAWLAGLVNASLMTIIACANTSLQGTVAWVYGA
ncbi:MAG: alpha/beta hydrolase [Clostridia bacterium]|nr:alpha/beta hydrolase [Clostridia bacterium]